MRLSAEERDRLGAMVRAGKNSAQILTRARILLKADVSDAGEGWSDSAIAIALDTSINNVARTRQQLLEEGFEATLKRKYNPNSARAMASKPEPPWEKVQPALKKARAKLRGHGSMLTRIMRRSDDIGGTLGAIG